MANASTSAFEIGQLIADKYRIEAVLGEGGMGQVLLAMHLDLHEHCAVKVLHREALRHPDAYDRFVREARVARQLKSQHAVKVYDFGRLASGEPYIVMECLEGLDLRELQRQRGPLPVSDAVKYLTQACEAIGEAHAAGIIHRDIKPANLFLTKGVHGRPCIKVLDFGIAKVLDRPGSGQEREMTGNAMMGTLAYMSPEQMMSSRTVDHRADIWSLGVVLFRLLTDTLPFDDDGDGFGIVDSVINGTPRSLADHDPSFSPGLCAAVSCCLQKDREQRYPTAMDLADALSPFFVPDPRPSSARASRWDHTLDVPTVPISRPHPSSPTAGPPAAGPPAGGPSAAGPFAIAPAAVAPVAVAPDEEKTTVRAPLIEPRATPVVTDSRTDVSWAKTGRRVPESRSRLWAVGGSMVGVAGLFVAVWLLVRNRDDMTVTGTDSGSPATMTSFALPAPTAAANGGDSPAPPPTAAEPTRSAAATAGADAAGGDAVPSPPPPPRGQISSVPTVSKTVTLVTSSMASTTTPPATTARPTAVLSTPPPPIPASGAIPPGSDPFGDARK